MELTDAVRDRHSTGPITDDAPDDARLRVLIALAAHSPDHAGLRPWRLVTLRGTDRDRLGQALAIGFGDEPGSAAAVKTAGKPLRAPLLLGIIFAPTEHPKVPEWEQMAAVAALITTLELVLFDAGWTAMWRTGPAVDLPDVLNLMGVGKSERLLGWLYIGGTNSATTSAASAQRRDPDVADRVSALPPQISPSAG
jgi:nitroreductase